MPADRETLPKPERPTGAAELTADCSGVAAERARAVARAIEGRVWEAVGCAAPQSAPDAAPGPAHRPRLLIVEDHLDTAESLAAVIRGMDLYEVTVALWPTVALAEAVTGPPDVAVLDFRLPGMAGDQLAAELRLIAAEVEGKRPFLVAVTGAGFEAERRCRDAGFDIVYRKPASPAALEHLLRDHAARLAAAPGRTGG
jgi:CheY-like chemotaxis protein